MINRKPELVEKKDPPIITKIKKMRAHYAALIQQIDYEVGQIIESLKKNNSWSAVQWYHSERERANGARCEVSKLLP